MGPYYKTRHKEGSSKQTEDMLAATTITPVRRSTPVKTIEVLYDIAPLHLYIQNEAEPETASWTNLRAARAFLAEHVPAALASKNLTSSGQRLFL